MRKTLLIAVPVFIFMGFKFISKNTYDVADRKQSETLRFENQLEKIRNLTAANSNYNDELAFLIDMKIPSGKKRFFVYSMKQNKIVDQGLVAHGSGSETGIDGKLKFSNINNSLCTSLGCYTIGKSYAGKFGKAYKLYGLDKTNSNANDRNIVLHKYSKVPYLEQPTSICNSFGCPMVNEIFYKRIEKIIDNSGKALLLNIYY